MQAVRIGKGLAFSGPNVFTKIRCNQAIFNSTWYPWPIVQLTEFRVSRDTAFHQNNSSACCCRMCAVHVPLFSQFDVVGRKTGHQLRAKLRSLRQVVQSAGRMQVRIGRVGIILEAW